MKIKKIKIPIYGGTLILIKSNDYQKINNKFKSELTNSMGGGFWSRTTKKGFYQYLIAFVSDKPSVEIVVHETVHLINEIYLNSGIEKDRVNDEPEAYLTGYLAEKIMKFCNE